VLAFATMVTPHDEHFWNALENYDEEVLSIFKDADAARPLVETITRHIGSETVVADLGTGTGNLLPYLKHAKKVYAVDKAENMIAKARQTNHPPNVEFIRADIRELTLPNNADLVVALNSLWPASLSDYSNLLAGTHRNLTDGGALVMMAMSFEAMLFYTNLHLAWRIECLGEAEPDAYRFLTRKHAETMNNMFGFVQVKSNLLQKFWGGDELSERLESHGFTVIQISKHELPWGSYFPQEPEWIKQRPNFWMWCVEARKKPR
jgi:ubiquinone/menaquinone biosynthesis C-methylase UbiE